MVQLSYKVKLACGVHVRMLLASQLASMPLLPTSIIVKYMDIVSRVLARHTTGNLIVTDGPCQLGHQVKKRDDSTYMQIHS